MIIKHGIYLSAILVGCFQLGASPIVITSASYQLGASNAVGSATCAQAPGSCTISGATATISMSPLPVLTASAVGNADALANANYYYVISNAAGTLDTTVSVDVDYKLFTQEDTSPGNNTQAGAEVLVTTSFGQTSASAGYYGNQPAVSGTLHLSGLSGRNNAVAVFAAAGGNAGSAFASADPYIYIDPSFINTGGYTITVSDGVGNTQVSSTPEPASFILVGMVLAGAGCFRRCSRGVRKGAR
jgi:hypothetical protein